jgi:proteasome accessory factor C
VTIHLAPAARWVVEYYPVEAVRPHTDGSLEVDLLVADQAWLRRLLLRLAPNARVLVPESAAESFTAASRETLRLYE